MIALFSDHNVQFVLRTLLRLGAPARDAEDLAQEVFVVAHRRAVEFDASRLAAPWLFGITKNVLRDYRKLARNRYEVMGGMPPEQSVDAPVRDDTDLLRRAIAALPEELSDVVILCDLSELTVIETASALNVPEGTLKDRLRRARRELRAHIDRLRRGVTCG